MRRTGHKRGREEVHQFINHDHSSEYTFCDNFDTNPYKDTKYMFAANLEMLYLLGSKT